MSATTSHDSATENPALHDHLVTGETLFITGAVIAFLSDIVLTFRALVLPNWIGLTIGSLMLVVTLYIVNWVYTGKKQARTAALIWSIVQIAVAVLCVGLLLNRELRLDYRFYPLAEVLPPALAVVTPLLGAFKIVAFGLFAYLVTQKGPALFFLRHRDGETLEPPSLATPPEDIKPTGVLLPLAAPQNEAAESLASTLQNAGCALMAAGFFLAIVGGQRIAATPRLGWITLGEGLILLVVGLLSMNPVTALRNISDRGSDTAYVTDALGKLAAISGKFILLALALVALTIAGIVLRMGL